MNSSVITLSEKIPLNEHARRISLTGLSGSANALSLARVRAQISGDILVICPDAQTAQSTLNDLRFFLPLFVAGSELPELLAFPGWEISPYSKLAPIIGNRVQRLRCIQELNRASRKQALVVASIQAIAQPTLAPETLRARILSLHTGDTYEFNGLRNRLAALGYAEADPVEDPGTFAIRGGILDVYPIAANWPARLFHQTKHNDPRDNSKNT